MASTFSASLKLAATTTETISGDDLTNSATAIHDGYDTSVNLTSSTTPDLTKTSYQTVTLSSGSATIDMTSLSLNGATVNLNALKPRWVLFNNPSTNSNNITIAKGASNGYDGLGASFSITLEPNMSMLVYFKAQGNAVSGSNKTLDISGTGTETLEVSFGAGT